MAYLIWLLIGVFRNLEGPVASGLEPQNSFHLKTSRARNNFRLKTSRAKNVAQCLLQLGSKPKVES
jgi:hypothetical protein